MNVRKGVGKRGKKGANKGGGERGKEGGGERDGKRESPTCGDVHHFVFAAHHRGLSSFP